MNHSMMSSTIGSDLAQVKPFNNIPSGELERLSALCARRKIKAGDMIYSEEDWVDQLWALTGGVMRMSILPPFGGQASVNLLRTGDLVGCLNGVCRHKHPMEGLALTDCDAIVIPKARYLDLLDQKDFGRGIIHVLGERLLESQLMRAVSGEPSERRMAWTLLWLHGKLGRRIPMTRRMLAETAGVARETAIRVLSPLEKKGWIKTHRGLMEIIKPERLREVLEGR